MIGRAMSREEFVAAMSGLGVTLKPDPEKYGDCQYQCPDDPGELGDGPKRSSISMDEGILLSILAGGLRVVEFGTGLGVSTVCLAYSATEVVTIDPDEWVHENVKLNSNVRMVRSVGEAGKDFDLAFIDGLHDAASVRRDIEDALRIVKRGGQVVFHDMSQITVREVVERFCWGTFTEYDTIGRLRACRIVQ